jgi:hypothetical protein
VTYLITGEIPERRLDYQEAKRIAIKTIVACVISGTVGGVYFAYQSYEAFRLIGLVLVLGLIIGIFSLMIR